jgi:hypothetical protein
MVETDDTPEMSTSTVTAPRPLLPLANSAKPGITVAEHDSEAEKKTVSHKQSRKRFRILSDGTTVLEEQEVYFTEVKTVWGPP